MTITVNQSNLDPASTRSFLVLPQVDQHLAEALLARAAATTDSALARDINQLRNALPAGATGGGVLAAGQELFGFGLGLGAVLV